MESLYLKTFLEVVKSGSVSRAAETLCVTQPAVSRRIKFMEEQYGYPLIDRSGQSFKLTEAGRLVQEKAEKLLEMEEELLSGLRSLSTKRSISFCCTPAFGIAHLPVILKDFMLEYAELADLKFVFDMPEKIVQGMQEGLFDLALIEHCNCFDLSEFVTFALPGDDMIFVSSPKLDLTSPLAGIDELLSCTLFARKEGCCSRTMLKNNLQMIGRSSKEFRKLVVFDDLHLTISAAQEGDGITFLSRDLVKEQLAAGTLLEHQVDGFHHHRQRTLVMNSNNSKCTDLLENFSKAIFSHFDMPSPHTP